MSSIQQKGYVRRSAIVKQKKKNRSDSKICQNSHFSKFTKQIWVRKDRFQFLWIMVLYGATINAALVVGVVSLLLLKLSSAILCRVNQRMPVLGRYYINVKMFPKESGMPFIWWRRRWQSPWLLWQLYKSKFTYDISSSGSVYGWG